MSTKIQALIAVIIVIVIAAAGAVYLMGDDDKDDKQIIGADNMAKQLVDNYSGDLGDFKIKDGATSESAIITSTPLKYIGDVDSDEVSSNSLVIYYFEKTSDAETKYNDLVTGMSTKSSMTSDLGVTVYDNAGAAKFGCDKLTVHYWSRDYAKTGTYDVTKYSTANGVALIDGKFVVDFSQIPGKGIQADNTKIYFGLPIETENNGQYFSVTKAEFEGVLQGFLKSFTTAQSNATTITDSYGRTVTVSKVPEKVAVVNTDIMFAMQILGLEDKIVAMDTDGRADIPSTTSKVVQSNIIDLGKRSAFSASTALEKMKNNGVDLVLSPTSMGIGSTVNADTIETNGIKVAYINAYGSDMLDNFDLIVKLFGNTYELQAKAFEFRNYFNSFVEEAKTIKTSADPSQNFLIYLVNSKGTVGQYYVSTSEISGIVTSVSGHNRATATEGSYEQYSGEALYALMYDGTAPAVDYLFLRGTDKIDVTASAKSFGEQTLTGSYSMKDYIDDNDTTTVYLNTRIASGVMCCLSYLVYAYVFTDSLSDTVISDIEKDAAEFEAKYGFTFPFDAEHPLVQVLFDEE